jgi:DNA-binding transcriptional ArsR family regulator
MPENPRIRIEEQAEIHQILSNPSRLLILCSLAQKELSVSEIAEEIGASLQNTSQHLRLMKDKGVVEGRREGQTIFYQIASSEVGDNCKRMLTCFQNQNQSIIPEA